MMKHLDARLPRRAVQHRSRSWPVPALQEEPGWSCRRTVRRATLGADFGGAQAHPGGGHPEVGAQRSWRRGLRRPAPASVGADGGPSVTGWIQALPAASPIARKWPRPSKSRRRSCRQRCRYALRKDLLIVADLQLCQILRLRCRAQTPAPSTSRLCSSASSSSVDEWLNSLPYCLNLSPTLRPLTDQRTGAGVRHPFVACMFARGNCSPP